jgi:AmmeMemoRadiSam system protein B
MKSVNQTLVYQNPELPVPPLRYDINMIPFNDEDGDWVLFYDTFGYAVPDMTLPSNFAPLFQLFDGRQTLSSIHKQYFRKSDFSLSDLTNLIYQLDQSRLLHSSYFRKFVDEFEGAFETSANRLATCTDSCYPSDSSELRKWLDAAFAEHPNSEPTPFKALYAPHIDYRVGIKTYVKAFSALRELKPKRVVILGTSHYAGYYGKLYENRPFIFSGKDLKTPLGLLKSNKSIHDQASKLDGLQYGISMNDRAHRVEHSIELHALLCQYLWGDAIEVVSILVGSLEEYVLFESGTQGKQIQKMASFIRSLDDGETLFLVSGDQAHIGKKIWRC